MTLKGHTGSNHKNPDTIEGMDIRRFLTKLLERWQVYLIGVLLAIILTTIFHRYAVPRYSVVSTLLNYTEHVTTHIAEQSEIERQNMLNELEILRSTQVMRRAIENAGLFYEMYEIGLFQQVPINDSSPFNLEIKLLQPEVIFDLRIGFEVINGSTVLIRESNVDEIVPGTEHSMPLNIASEYLSIDFHAVDPELAIGKSFTLRVVDPLSRALAVKEVMEVELTNTQSTVTRIQIESADPSWAVRFIDRLIMDYKKLKVEHKNESILNSLSFINEQVALIKKKLNQIEFDLVRFREINKTIDINAEGSAVLTTLLELENEMASKKLQMNYYTQFTAQMNSSDSNQVFVNPSAVGITDRVFNEAVTSLNSMILDLNQLRTSSTEINPRYKALERSISHQIELLKSSIEDYKTSTQISIQQLQERIAEQEDEIRKLPSTQKNLISLQREFDMNETMYLYLEERRAEAEIMKASNISKVQVIDRPYVLRQVFPRETLNYLVAVLVAMFLVYFTTTAYDLSAQKLDSASDLTAKTNLPVIGKLPEQKGKMLLPTKEALASQVTDSFRRLTTSLRDAGGRKQLIQVYSPTDREGRAYTAANIAVMLARYEHKVILVDANVRTPRIAHFLSVTPPSTVASYLNNDRKDLTGIIQSTDISNLDVIAGSSSKDGPELLPADRLSALFDALRKEYEYIIVDTAPLQTYPDALDLVAFADYGILVISKRHTTQSALSVIEDLHRGSENLEIGLVFNQQRQPLI